MNVSLRSISKDDNEQFKKKSTLNRFLSFNENTLLSVENHHYLNTESIIKEANNNNNLNKNHSISFSYICKQCLKIFVCDYGLNYHINMSHPNQSIICSDCNIKFRTHRALKNHQQRLHLIYSQENLPDYSYISSYLVIAFSTKQFPFIAKNACEDKRLPLGNFSSKLFQCQQCLLSFPCSKTLKYHLLNKHEQYEYKICQNILYDIILQVEQNLTINNDNNNNNDIESIKFLLSKQASYFGLIDKQLAKKIHHIKQEQYRHIFPTCQHQNRTCANLCLNYLSSYNKLIQNYSYKITNVPKGNPFIQGSILSKSLNKSSINSSIISKECSNTNQKRLSLKRVKSSCSDDLSSVQLKKKFLPTIVQQFKTNETKLISSEQSSSIVVSLKKTVTKNNPTYVRSLSSMSSNSSTSTRTSSKISRQQQSTTSLKRSISPTITLAVERSAEKRRRQREQRKARVSPSSSVVIIKTNDDIEQENDDDDEDDNNNNVVSRKSEQSKQQRRSRQRQASNSSVEYVQILNHDQQSISSLNNIENLKVKSKTDDEEIIICHSPPSIKQIIPSSNKNQSEKSVNDNGIYKTNGHQTPDYDENVRVRCKVCGEILQGRSRFSQHVLTMHSHLVKNNIANIKQQPTTVVR
ncbi:unnamed protein product [Rotaria sordida]|uniref:C2H2-type domain-containing protein n=1 Tax=Rotaria sordida TaxID=392033 RepID=A0A814HML4_9BILA|nr:unnamed protein product [Rotaria sordida]